MEAAHDIHNRSRNRKQQNLRPHWKQQGGGQQKSPWQGGANSNASAIVDSADHVALTESLHELCVARRLIESPEGTQKRRQVMRDLDNMLFAWSESLLPGSPSYEDNLASPNPDKSDAPSLLSFGSYRLQVHTPDADVDCLVLAPPHVTREDFFGSWVDVLKGEERVRELHPVASAYTPVIKFEMDSVKIDLIFARVNNSKWLSEQRTKMTPPAVAEEEEDKDPEDQVAEMSVDDDVLIGLDETSVRSVNGVRVAQFLLDMLDGDSAQLDNFRLTLRAVKEWARVHGLYANVLGFLGGVNWAILVCWICKRNKDAPASKLLQTFFRTYANWKWPSPVLLAKQNQPPKGVQPMPIWNPAVNYRDAKHIMPIITPCYPPMNSSYNVGEPQLRRLRDELRRASKLSNDILAGKKSWPVLFDRNSFFKQHANYLQVDITGANEDDFRSWLGFIESRIRLLIAGLESPVAGVRAYPFAKLFRGDAEGKFISSFFIALRFADSSRRVDLGPLVSDFLAIVNSYEGRAEGMDLIMYLKSKQTLPSYVFADEEANDDVEHLEKALSKDAAADTSKENVDGQAETQPKLDEAETPIKRKMSDELLGESPSSAMDVSPLKRTRMG